MKIGVVLVCAGVGKRLGKAKDKALLRLNNHLLFEYTFKAFSKIRKIKQIVLVLRKRHLPLAKRLIKDKRLTAVKGGKERKDSVHKGLLALNKDIEYVLIHDGARPFVTRRLIVRMLKELKRFPAVVAGIESKDTVKLVRGSSVIKTLNREDIYLIQTPQGFRKDLILNAYRKSKVKNPFDDAQLLERLGKKVKIVEGDIFNIKITYPEDVVLAKALLRVASRE